MVEIMKNNRHNAIMKLIQSKKIRTHEQLVLELANLGFKVTQATISRDIKVLGLTKFSDKEGSYYGVGTSKASHGFPYNDYVKSVKCGQNLVVIKTQPGTASAVASAIDSMFESDILGSIAGDDAIFIATETLESAELIREKLSNFFGK